LQDWGTHRVFVNPPYGRKRASALRRHRAARWSFCLFPLAPTLVGITIGARERPTSLSFVVDYDSAMPTLARGSRRCSRSTHLTGPLRRAPGVAMALSLAATPERAATHVVKRFTAVEMLRLRCNGFHHRRMAGRHNAKECGVAAMKQKAAALAISVIEISRRRSDTGYFA
jgi:hypothetical protein